MSQLTKDHFESICRILSELSTGNLGYRLGILEGHRNFNLLGKYINRIGELLKQYRAEHKNTTPAKVQMEFDLTGDFYIRGASHTVQEILGQRPRELLGKPFEELLGRESAGNLAGLRHHFLHRGNFPVGLPFYFKVNRWLLFSCFCYFFQYQDGSIRVNTFKREQYGMIEHLLEKYCTPPIPKDTYLSTGIDEKTGSNRTAPNHERERMNIILQYIEENLDDSLPNIKALADHFTITEKKLSNSFKKMYQQTPYTYYMGRKLLRAMELLKTSDLSIEEIAFNIGYNARSGFHKAFKKKFGITPGVVQREA